MIVVVRRHPDSYFCIHTFEPLRSSTLGVAACQPKQTKAERAHRRTWSTSLGFSVREPSRLAFFCLRSRLWPLEATKRFWLSEETKAFVGPFYICLQSGYPCQF